MLVDEGVEEAGLVLRHIATFVARSVVRVSVCVYVGHKND